MPSQSANAVSISQLSCLVDATLDGETVCVAALEIAGIADTATTIVKQQVLGKPNL